jgi:hypothetical protein
MSPEQVETLRQNKRKYYLKKKALSAGNLQTCGSLMGTADVGSTPSEKIIHSVNGIFEIIMYMFIIVVCSFCFVLLIISNTAVT